MKFILSNIPVVEDLLRVAVKTYFQDLRWHEMYPHHPGINISTDHPFERLLDVSNGNDNTLFPAITIVSSSDSEIPGASKNWEPTTLEDGDIDEFDNLPWYVSDTALADLQTALTEKTQIFGLKHATTWRDSVSFEIWTENMQVKNDLYNLLMGFLSGPKIMEFKQAHGITIHSNSIQGQRSGYYNYDFGRVLYGGRIAFQADYPILQAVYDTEIESLAEIEHSYREVLHG